MDCKDYYELPGRADGIAAWDEGRAVVCYGDAVAVFDVADGVSLKMSSSFE